MFEKFFFIPVFIVLLSSLTACSTTHLSTSSVIPLSAPSTAASVDNSRAATTVAMAPTPIVAAPVSPADVALNVQAFAVKAAKSDGLPLPKIVALLKQAQMQPTIIKLMNQPFEQLPWYRYQSLYVRPSLITGGVQFWQQHESILSSASKQFGVPPEIMVAILGVETGYGVNQGSFRALDALYTLSFYYPRRATYFQSELEAYLTLTHDAGFNPLIIKSSYAGALGMPQFMPSTYRQYAVASAKLYPNLFSNPDDAIGSVANFFAKVGWTKGAPIAVPAHLSKGVVPTDIMQNGNLSLDSLKKLGVHAESHLNGKLPANLIILQTKNGPEYWLAFHNFYMIKRYNSSTLYAMAVYQLGTKIAVQRTLPF